MTTTVSVVGLGHMGRAMATRLVGQGFIVGVWNRTRSVADSLAREVDVVVLDTAEAAARFASVVVSSLADDAALQAVYLGARGLVAGLQPGTIVLETSTVDPETVRDLSPHVAARGSALLDTPVSGSVSMVEAGTLTVMVGGDAARLTTVEGVLAAVAARVVHLGPVGAGATMKLAVNALLHAINVALSESLVLADAAGIDRSAAYDVFASGAAGAPYVQYKREAFLEPDVAASAFLLALAAKDLRLALALAARSGVPMAQATAGSAVVDAAVRAGFGDRDMSTVAVYLRGRLGS